MIDPPDRVARYRATARAVEARIAAACQRVGRDPASVQLVAVSKTVPADALRDALRAGIAVLGENRVQEAAAKAPDVPGARWQLVGPLQSNKARRAVELFECVQSVESVELASRLGRLAEEVRPGRGAYPILLQVNVDDDPAKAGLPPGDVADVAERIARLGTVELRGLMTIGRLGDDPEAARPTFRRLRGLSERLVTDGLAIGHELSMGMTDDFEVAVEEGATIVRVGRAIFGDRPPIG